MHKQYRYFLSTKQGELLGEVYANDLTEAAFAFKVTVIDWFPCTLKKSPVIGFAVAKTENDKFAIAWTRA